MVQPQHGTTPRFPHRVKRIGVTTRGIACNPIMDIRCRLLPHRSDAAGLFALIASCGSSSSCAVGATARIAARR